MRTLGIDLASEETRTAACVIEWSSGKARIAALEVPVDDDLAVTLIEDADWTGIDAPFGWPDAAVAAVAAHHRGQRWPKPTPEDLDLRFRATDLAVRNETGIWPLSASSDRIAVPAWRCARILARITGSDERGGTHNASAADAPPLPAIDRLGRDQIVEVYPAAALHRWGLPHKGYKSSGNAEQKQKAKAKRTPLLAKLIDACGSWLQLDATTRERCEDNDDAFDALVASLVTRASALGKSDKPDAEQKQRAAREGWIHLPTSDSLAMLAVGR
jgi:predicted nuclease with RNAse H fold